VIANGMDTAVTLLAIPLVDDDDVYLYKNYNERVSQNLYSIRFHTDQAKVQKNIYDNKE
jgi:hypothetical protein